MRGNERTLFPLKLLFFIFVLVLGYRVTSVSTAQQTAPSGNLPIISAYTVVQASQVQELESKVREKLQDDWVPQGGIEMTNSGEYLQALIK